jgi:hypothetical protein
MVNPWFARDELIKKVCFLIPLIFKKGENKNPQKSPRTTRKSPAKGSRISSEVNLSPQMHHRTIKGSIIMILVRSITLVVFSGVLNLFRLRYPVMKGARITS